jgi:hypothetical protein
MAVTIELIEPQTGGIVRVNKTHLCSDDVCSDDVVEAGQPELTA